ncbi:alanine acetyltransferase [Candidatus Tenderia electrophaga]|jgi:hypothetical protein|uniref:Alanine acetyltransferase n=1 Tax=Candidatus Tenderia electrophaga TaxID=1748243 RepID=A0A0S2TDQ5_9GAMM|nr:alanine acetyltransferase [Candidatus Tenderia electrophaga]
MHLQGSCHCGSVRFELDSAHPYPYNLCYCSICRKTAGGGGYAINLGGAFDSMKVTGSEHVSVYQAHLQEAHTGVAKQSPGQRHFCSNCGSALWVWDPRWPELVHPFASAIDTELPRPPQRSHMMLASKAPWVQVRAEPQDRRYDGYPEESLAQWHRRLGLEDSVPGD